MLYERLRHLRKANGWNLAPLAARVGISVSYLSDLERGKTDPSVATLMALARAYGMTPVELVRGTDDWEG